MIIIDRSPLMYLLLCTAVLYVASALPHEFPPLIFSLRSIFSPLFRRVTPFVCLHTTSLILDFGQKSQRALSLSLSLSLINTFRREKRRVSQLEANTAVHSPSLHSPSLPLKRLNHTIIYFLQTRTYDSPA